VITDLLTASSIKYLTFSKAFDMCRYSYNYKDDLYTNPTELIEENINSSSNTKDKTPKEEEPLKSFKAFTR
jgi:hypothetical protein